MKASSEISPGADEDADVRPLLARWRELVDARLDRIIPAETSGPVNVHGAIRWSLFAGGKRSRPLLVLSTGLELGAESGVLLDTACALEMIHTYSLIHDDLPSMDDDDLRRGRPTCHVRFGEATAILAGDASYRRSPSRPSRRTRSFSPRCARGWSPEVARASGTPEGMVAGQAHDLTDRVARGDGRGA